MGIKLVAATLAGALGAGVGVFLWRQAELDSRQERLLRTARARTYAELGLDRLEEKVTALRRRLRTVRGRLAETRTEGPEVIVAPAPSPEPDGRYFGFIESIDTGTEPATIVTDFASMLSGGAANRAAVEAGVIAPGEGVPNDYFITNVNPRLRTLELDPSIATVIETGGPTGGPDRRSIPLARFVRLFDEAEGVMAGIARNGYWITIRDGRVTRLREQWVP